MLIKRGILLVFIFSFLALGVFAQEEDVGDVFSDIGDVELKEDAGMTPDSPFYFIEDFFEGLLVGDNPELALSYKNEKIVEARQMIEQGNVEGAKKALLRAEKYGEILKREVSPEIERKVRESSKAVKEVFEDLLDDISGDEWKEVREQFEEHGKREDKIALAAKVSSTIQKLCEQLSQLDPLEYSRICKTDDDSPGWQRQLDNRLTKGQEKEAKEFFGIMSTCFENPQECECDKITIPAFAKKCNTMAPLAAKCMDGDEDACEEMDDIDDEEEMFDLLPDYLKDVLGEVQDKYDGSKYDLHIPIECREAGALNRKDCELVMFKKHAPEECVEALEKGKIDIKNRRKADKACEEIMFKSDAPEECIEAGIKDHKECNKFMFKFDAPEECIEAGLTGEGRNDWKECDLIRFKLESPEECLDAGLTGAERSDYKKCDVIRFKLDAPEECLDAGLTGKGRGDWKKCELIRFKLDAPEECIEAGLTGEGRNDWKECEAIRFKSDAPEECLDAGLTGKGRNDWKECEAIRFKLDAPEECLDAGLTGKGRDDWKKCELIRFKLDAPEECLDAGLTGKGRDDWKKCDKIQRELERERDEEWEHERRERDEEERERDRERDNQDWNEPPEGDWNEPPEGDWNEPPEGDWNEPPEGDWNEPPEGDW
ncbi:hypothetical protein KY313_02305, partial [Candidatus Woesearchaeota archaeon]|nr:hypothetical protein [Candidatus Woesearchaeota archaeon]